MLLLLACSGSPPPEPTPPAPTPPPAPKAACTLLTINDTYRIEPLADGTGGMARVRTVRKQLEAEGPVLLLHAGDFLAPSLMSRTYKGSQMIEVLDALDGDVGAVDERMFVVFGNHEFDAGDDADGPALDATIAASQFWWLGTNITFKTGAEGPIVADDKLVNDAIVDCGGLKVGIFGLTTDGKSAKYIDSFAPILPTAEAETAALRKAGAEVVVALTHQARELDESVLTTLREKGPDLIVGGHEHDHQSTEILGRPLVKADADAHTAWKIGLRREGGTIAHDLELLTLDASVAEDPAVAQIVATRIDAHDGAFCTKRNLPKGCLSDTVGTAGVPLVAAELEVRRFETNLGDWVADTARAAFPDADIAFVNSGSLRLNRDLAAGPVKRQDIEELFAYPTPLVRIEIDGATLQKVVDRAVQEWSGNGHWLQVSGFAWKHDPQLGTATALTRISTGAPIAADEKLVAVVPAYIVDPTTKRDGYTMLPAVPNPTGPDLKQLVYDALAKGAPLAPKVEGRICNPMRPGPCLAK